MNNVLICVILTTFLLLGACSSFKTDPSTCIEKLKVNNKGVNIDYEDIGAGDITLLLIHGWNIDKSYWLNQSEFFSENYRVVIIDLPGHGKSGKNRDNWIVEEFGKDITAVINQLDLRNVILIGHSMSGAIVVESALKNPMRVIGVVGVDNFSSVGKELSPEEKSDISEAYKALRLNYRETVIQYANQSLFSPSTSSAIRKRVVRDFVNADSDIAVEIIEQNENYPLVVKLKALGKTIFLLNSDYNITDTSGFKKYNIPFDLQYVGPTGHYPMIEDPDKFNNLLDRVIQKIVETNDKHE